MPYDVIVEQVEAEPMAAVAARARRAELADAIRGGLDEVYALLRATDPGPLGCNVVFYLPFAPGETQVFDLRIGVRLSGAFAPQGKVIAAETPAGRAAHVVYFGPYSRMRAAHDAIHIWANQAGQRLTGASWEVYDDWSEDPAQLRTDVYYQLEDAARG